MILATLIAQETAPAIQLFIAASTGNILGSVVNYWLGIGIERLKHHRWFPANEAQLSRAQTWYQRLGVWSLLLSWAPMADPLTVLAGVMRTPFWLFLLLVTIAKTGRYAAVIWLCDLAGFCG